MAAPTILSLCAGAGGLDLAVRVALPEARTVCYVEHEISAAALLAARIADGSLDDAPLWSDLRRFDGRPWRGLVDGIIASPPCQPFSVAGRRRGADDDRNMWPEAIRVVGEVRPDWCFFENVGASLRYYWEQPRAELQGLGYECTEVLAEAAAVGAPHRRERLFVLAHAHGGQQNTPDGALRPGGGAADPGGSGVFPPGPDDYDAWARVLAEMPEVEPAVCRMANGLADELDLIRAQRITILGNGVVPLQAAAAFSVLAERLMGHAARAQRGLATR